jgi:hypothetical protein
LTLLAYGQRIFSVSSQRMALIPVQSSEVYFLVSEELFLQARRRLNLSDQFSASRLLERGTR